MAKVRDVLDALERIAPKRFAFSFDRVGLQVGDPHAEVERAVVSLDRSLAAVRYAAKEGAQMLISHHPLIFEPLPAVISTSNAGRTVIELIRNGINFAAAHTNWDSARGGINDTLAHMFSLSDVRAFGSAAEVEQLKLVVFTPVEAAEQIIGAASEAGAGIIGDYDRCNFLCEGTGSYRGRPGTNPTIGKPENIERIPELRVEMVLLKSKQMEVERAVRRVHPYEEPAIDFLRLLAKDEQPAGRIGGLPEPMAFRDLVAATAGRLQTSVQGWGKSERIINKLAVVGGSADSEWRKAQRAGADALLTGEVKQHVGLEASEEGFAIMAAGHYATEHPGCITLAERLRSELPEIEWMLFEPKLGEAGRPLIA